MVPDSSGDKDKLLMDIVGTVERLYQTLQIPLVPREIASEALSHYFEFLAKYNAEIKKPPKIEIKWPVKL